MFRILPMKKSIRSNSSDRPQSNHLVVGVHVDVIGSFIWLRLRRSVFIHGASCLTTPKKTTGCLEIQELVVKNQDKDDDPENRSQGVTLDETGLQRGSNAVERHVDPADQIHQAVDDVLVEETGNGCG